MSIYYFFTPVLRCLNCLVLLIGEGSQSNVLLPAAATGVFAFFGVPIGWSPGFSVGDSSMGCDATGSLDEGTEVDDDGNDDGLTVCCHEEAQAE